MLASLGSNSKFGFFDKLATAFGVGAHVQGLKTATQVGRPLLGLSQDEVLTDSAEILRRIHHFQKDNPGVSLLSDRRIAATYSLHPDSVGAHWESLLREQREINNRDPDNPSLVWISRLPEESTLFQGAKNLVEARQNLEPALQLVETFSKENEPSLVRLGSAKENFEHAALVTGISLFFGAAVVAMSCVLLPVFASLSFATMGHIPAPSSNGFLPLASLPTLYVGAVTLCALVQSALGAPSLLKKADELEKISANPDLYGYWKSLEAFFNHTPNNEEISKLLLGLK